ncbi:uncharacterized protein OCT59_021041 [Rhizophagus irregularis]|uniref:uncharacterized protein n=1 Tax=Rhizophagus irregularis TaxID=588596 RepID=UPI00332F5BBA|nr:hypothetical protein OCT59_021041 [Rhizophagus irregularis]
MSETYQKSKKKEEKTKSAKIAERKLKKNQKVKKPAFSQELKPEGKGRSWFLAALRKRQVFGSLQFFMGGQWFLVLVAFREKVFCSLRARKFRNAE